MKVLVLDDLKERHDQIDQAVSAYDPTAGIWHVYTTEQAKSALSSTRFDVAYLDHDLGEWMDNGYGKKIEATGTHVAWFIANELPPEKRPRVIIHSMNPVGAERMMSILKDAGVRVTQQAVSSIIAGVGP
jgi:hypothetical protein